MVDRLSATRGDPSVRTQLDTGERRQIDPALWLGNRKKRRAPSSAACQRILACPGEIYSTLPLENYSNDLLAGYRHWLDHCLPYLRHQHCLMLLKRDSPGRTQRRGLKSSPRINHGVFYVLQSIFLRSVRIWSLSLVLSLDGLDVDLMALCRRASCGCYCWDHN